jgi:hypothetical protein
MSYFKKSRNEPPIARVIYSRPQKKGRVIFGELVPYDKIWRTGANEATEINFYQDVTFAGQSVKAGSYSLFTIPGQEKWVIILSSQLHQWGAYRHQNTDEVMRAEVPTQKTSTPVEHFSIAFDFKNNSDSALGSMYLAWDNVQVEIPITKASTKASNSNPSSK